MLKIVCYSCDRHQLVSYVFNFVNKVGLTENIDMFARGTRSTVTDGYTLFTLDKVTTPHNILKMLNKLLG